MNLRNAKCISSLFVNYTTPGRILIDREYIYSYLNKNNGIEPDVWGAAQVQFQFSGIMVNWKLRQRYRRNYHCLTNYEPRRHPHILRRFLPHASIATTFSLFLLQCNVLYSQSTSFWNSTKYVKNTNGLSLNCNEHGSFKSTPCRKEHSFAQTFSTEMFLSTKVVVIDPLLQSHHLSSIGNFRLVTWEKMKLSILLATTS